MGLGALSLRGRAVSGLKSIEIVPADLDANSLEISDAGAPSDSKFESLHKATHDLVHNSLIFAGPGSRYVYMAGNNARNYFGMTI